MKGDSFLQGVLLVAAIVFIACCYIGAIYKISREDFPVFIKNALLFIFACIAFLFGIHADIFSSYDKSNSKLKKRYTYSWFSPVDILKFPFDQHSINERDYANENSIDIGHEFSNNPKKEKRKITIIVDKTPSIKKDKTSDEDFINKQITSFLINSLSRKKEETKKALTGLDLEDLILIDLIEQIGIFSNDSTKFEVLYYCGNDKLFSPDEFQFITKTNYKQIIKYFIQSCKYAVNPDSKPVQTDLKFIVDNLYSRYPINTTDSALFNSIYFISDFEHDLKSGSSFSDLNQSLKMLGTHESSIEQVSLIKIYGKNNKADIVNRTLSLFNENLNHLYYYEFDEVFSLNKNAVDPEKECNEFILSMFSRVNENSENTEPVKLYYSWDNSSYNYDYKGNIVLKNIANNSDLYIGYGNTDELLGFGIKNSYMIINSGEGKTYPFQLQKISQLREGDNISIKYKSYKNDSKNSFLEIHKPQTLTKVRVPIIFRQVLPDTSCVYLIGLYFLFFISVYYYILYFILYRFIKIREGKKFLNFKTFFFLCVFSPLPPWGLFMFFLAEYNYSVSGNFYWLTVFYVAFLCILFLRSKDSRRELMQNNANIMPSELGILSEKMQDVLEELKRIK